jgi:hypothetical protein
MCKDCWSRGPTESDLVDLEDFLTFWRLDVDINGSEMIKFVIEFVQYVRSGDNHLKLWGHWGALRSWGTNDPRERFGWTRHPASPADVAAGGQWAFDPTNRVCGRTMNAICPNLRARLGWTNVVSDSTCGDLIEAFIGVWLHCKDGWAPYHDEWKPTSSCFALDCAARYWERMTYNARCIFRVLDCYRITRVETTTTGLRTVDYIDEVTITDAIHWAGTHYKTTLWQLHDPPTTTTSNNNIRQLTQLQTQSPQSQSPQVMDGQPGSSDDIRPQTLTSYLQSLRRRPRDDGSDDEEPRDHTMDYSTLEEDVSSPSTYWSRPTNPFATDEDDDMSEIYYIYDSPTNPHLPASLATAYDRNDPPTYNDDWDLDSTGNHYDRPIYDDDGGADGIFYVQLTSKYVLTPLPGRAICLWFLHPVSWGLSQAPCVQDLAIANWTGTIYGSPPRGSCTR